jgi:hypothetical protein
MTTKVAGIEYALSIGFIPNSAKTLQLEEGQSDGEGDGEIIGPATIIRD